MATLVRQDLTVQAGEVRTYVQNTGYAIMAGLLIGRYEATIGEVYFEPTVINYGEMHLDDGGFGTGQLLYFTASLSWNYGVTKNYGLMSAVTPAASSIRALFGPGWSPDVYNYGTIVASAQNDAIGYESWDGGSLFANGSGAILRAGAAERAVALYFPNGGTVTNDGQILAHVTGGGHVSVPDTATGLAFGFGSIFSQTSVINSGLIQASAANPAAQTADAIALRGGTTFSLVNTGTIRGTNAFVQYDSGPTGSVRIENRGTIEGRVLLHDDNDTFLNLSQMIGDVDLGAGDDVYDGALGTVTGPVRGGAGNDRLTSGAGDQQLFGNDGDDRLDGGAGNDLLDGGAGLDTASYATAAAGVTVSLAAAGFQATGGAGSDSLAAIENLLGSDHNDILTGDGSANQIAGGGGNDRLVGGGGADRLDGGSAGDVFVFGNVADSTAAAPDRIVGFETGLDKIDLLGLGPLSLSWQSVSDGSGTYILVTAVAAAGTLTVRVENTQALSRSDFLVAGSASDGDDELLGTDGPDTIDGLGGNDRIDGGAGADELRSGTGTDRLEGGSGNDLLYFGASFTGADRADGGADRDVLVLQGSYDLVLSAANIANVESLSLQSGGNSRWGDTANNLYDYAIATVDANVPAGVQLIVNGQSLRAGEDFAFDGSAELDGKFLVYAGHGTDLLKGGAGGDVFFFEGTRWSPDDRVDGGAGPDAVIISSGSGLNRFVFGEDSFTSIESISVNARFASDPSQKPSYELVLANGNVASGGRLILNGNSITDPNQFLNFDGSAIRDGNLSLFGGAAHDTLRGGSGADLLYGARGADSLIGGAGADTFRYVSAEESLPGLSDMIADFAVGLDKVDLQGIDANIHAAGDQAFTWIGSNAFSGAPGQLRVVASSGLQRVEGDVDGDGGADFAVTFQVGTAPLTAGDFIL